MEQTITVKLNLKEGQEPYIPISTGGYRELQHFFEDIGYSVASIKVTNQ